MNNKDKFISDYNNFRINQKTLIKDLNIIPEIDKFSYLNKDYYLYTPAKQRSGNKISWKCKLYRSNELKLKGNKRLCHGQIFLYKKLIVFIQKIFTLNIVIVYIKLFLIIQKIQMKIFLKNVNQKLFNEKNRK